MSFLITILLNILASYLASLIEKWLLTKSDNHAELVLKLAEAKPDFLSKVKFKFWLGPKRMERATKAYDLAIAKFPKIMMASSDGAPRAPRSIAEDMIAGVDRQLD